MAYSPTRAIMFLAAWALMIVTVLCDDAAPTVHAPAGTIIGNTSIPGLDQFLGIPYAKPPVGGLRFANPEPLTEALPEPFYATEYSPGCLQNPAFGLYNGLSEDCLTLNVIRPEGCAESKLPVLFWIHGGGNMNGQSIYYNGTALVEFAASIGEPVVYVSINYRLGGFGFLLSPDIQAAGSSNAGLSDQYLALQWVHENIEAFGGDPEKVTIFGESAGAWDCWSQLHHAYTQNESKKYFRGMITQSGAPGSPEFPHALAPETGLPAYQELLNATDCEINPDDRNDWAARLACLRAVPAETVSPLITAAFVTQFTLDNKWFSRNLTDSLLAYELAAIPILHGANLNEGAVFLPDPFDPPNASALTTYVHQLLDPTLAATTLPLAESIITVYLNTPLPSLGQGFAADPTAPHAFWPAVALYSDTTFHLGRRALLRAAASAHVPAWGFLFDQRPPPASLNLSYEYPGNTPEYAARIGVYHGAELPYVFGEASSVAGRTRGDVDVSTAVMRAWLAFAARGDPNAEGVPEWPEYGGREGEEEEEEEGGTVMVFAEQGAERIGAQPDRRRQGVYEAWNAAREALGLPAIY